MTHPQGIRQRFNLGYRQLVKTTLVNALRAVYDEYYDEEFRGIKIATEFPLERISYPAIQVRYDGRGVFAAGVGHEEYFKDNNGVFRQWDHRRFEGTIEFVILTVSPLDRDMLSDSLTEILTMGRMDDLLQQFFWTVYGEPDDQQQSFASTIYLNTDQISDGGESVGPAPWGPEDVLIYQTSMQMDTHGSFYSLVNTRDIGFVWQVTQEPYAEGDEPVSITYRPDLAWTPATEYEDTDGFATGIAEISASEA